ncbi:calcium-binding and coiled-coil domain-containing protein 2 [Anableps anableps]
METLPDEVAATDPPARTFSQVVFIDIPHSYPPSSPIICRFTLNAVFQPNPRDWVGIFKVGWSSTKDYHTFVWVEAVHDAQKTEMRQAVFKEYYLPKDESEFYQFCYIDNNGQVRGASTPFCFRNPSEQNTESIADDLVVIMTQEQVEQSQRENAELQKQLDLMRAENETLKSALLKDQKDISSFKDQNDQRETEKAKLIKEMDQVKEYNEKLKHTLQLQMKEIDNLKEEMVIQMTKRMEIQKQNSTEQEKLNSMSSRSNEEKYDRAVLKINQMKEEREELKGKIDAQSDEIAKLKAKLREAQRELSNKLDSIQLLQVDLQSSNKEKDRISLELQKLQSLMDEVKKENQELCRRLSQQDSLQRAPQDDLMVQCQTLCKQLQDTQAKLVAEREETRAVTRRAEFTENELQDVKEQLTSLARRCEMEERQSSKFEMLLKEVNEMLVDKNISIQDKEQEIILIKQERDELTKEIQSLKDNLERLRSVCTNIASSAAEEPSYLQPNPVAAGSDTPASHDQQDRLGQPENIYETIDSLLVVPREEAALVCRHCQESFPGITQQELEQHEQSHRVCPFCTMICDNMEQSIFEDHVYGHEL